MIDESIKADLQRKDPEVGQNTVWGASVVVFDSVDSELLQVTFNYTYKIFNLHIPRNNFVGSTNMPYSEAFDVNLY